MLLLLVCGVCLCLGLYWFNIKKTYFVKPGIIFLMKVCIQKKSAHEVTRELYQKFKYHKITVLYNFIKHSTYMIHDPQILKKVLVKDFHHFPNREILLPNIKDEPLTANLAYLKDENWKNLRIKLTSAFSTGKMRKMFPLVKACGENLVQILQKFTPSDDIEIKNLFERFFIDVFGTCAFGLETNTLKNPESEILKINLEAFNMLNRLPFVVRFIFPRIPAKIIKFFNLFLWNEKIEKFFAKLVQDTVKYREENKIICNDFLDTLIDLKKNTDMNRLQSEQSVEDLEKLSRKMKHINSNTVMTDDLLVAQVFIFSVINYESMSTSLSFLLLELALNPDIQNKVREEIITTLKANGDEFTHQVLNELKYTDMVIHESLRRYPTIAFTTRTCANTYEFKDTKIIAEKNDVILIPIYGLHMDKKYYENPDEFFPEHFTKEAIAGRPNCTYLPFGEGPRKCIAPRFAKMTLKVAITYLLKNYFFRISPKMKLPIKLVEKTAFLYTEGGIWLHCEQI